MRRDVTVGLLLAMGCGGAAQTDVATRGGATQFQGKFALVVMSGAAIYPPTNLPDGGTEWGQPLEGTGLDLTISDTEWKCWDPSPGPPPTTISALNWSLTRLNPNVISTGEYAAVRAFDASNPVGSASGGYAERRGDCLARHERVTAGTVKLDRLDGRGAEGWISATLDDGTRIDGEFLARRCDFVGLQIAMASESAIALPSCAP